MNIPSARQLKLARFKRPDFRTTTSRGKHASTWTWERAVYRLRRWLARAQADIVNVLHEPTRQLARAWTALRSCRPARMPKLDEGRITIRETGWHQTVSFPMRSKRRRLLRSRLMGARQSTPSRSGKRLVGAHRLERLAAMGSEAYMNAVNARNRYVTANLLRLKGLATSRAFGETTWMEARRADHFAT